MRHLVVCVCLLTGLLSSNVYAQETNENSGTLQVEKAETDTCGVSAYMGRRAYNRELKESILPDLLGVRIMLSNCPHWSTTKVLSFEMVTDDGTLKSNSNVLSWSMRKRIKLLKKGDTIELQNVYYKLEFKNREPVVDFISSEMFKII